jgi:hypothetical protein
MSQRKRKYGFSHNPLPVIASQRVGAKRRPMTGSAKQSIAHRKSMDCFVAALLAMTVGASGEPLLLIGG